MIPGRNGTTLEAAYSGRDNAFNFMRLCFALLVIVSHVGVLGWGEGHEPITFRYDLGGIAVGGFFALSGFLICRSGRRSSALRYVWHRILRIFPGYWVCLIATAFILAPLLFWYEHKTLHHFRGTNSGPFAYVFHNFLTDQRQNDVAHATAPAKFPGAINGSLWTLKSELTCYVLVLVLAVTAILRKARWVVLVLGAGLLAVIVWNLTVTPATAAPLYPLKLWDLPVGGVYIRLYLVVFAFSFVLGMIADLYRPVIPINDVLGVLAAILWFASMYTSWPVFGPAMIAYVYMLLWLGVRIPKALRRIGRKNDYSYGVYIYAFPVQQALSILGLPRYGLWVYFLTSVAVVLAIAMLSWHVVEKPAMRLKDWTPPFARKAKEEKVPNPDVPPAAHPAPIPTPRTSGEENPVPLVPMPRTARSEVLEPHEL